MNRAKARSLCRLEVSNLFAKGMGLALIVRYTYMYMYTLNLLLHSSDFFFLNPNATSYMMLLLYSLDYEPVFTGFYMFRSWSKSTQTEQRI